MGMPRIHTLSVILTFLLVFQTILCIPESEIFRTDWQTVGLGIPLTGLMLNDSIVTLTNKSILAIQNSRTGNVTYRYSSERPFGESSLLVKLSEREFASAFNYEQGSRIITWLYDGNTFVQNEIDMNDSVIGLFEASGRAIAVNRYGDAYSIGKTHSSVSVVHESEHSRTFDDAKYLETVSGKRIVLLSDSNHVYYTTLKTDSGLKRFRGCKIDDLMLVKSVYSYAICPNGKQFQYNEDKDRFESSSTESIAEGIEQIDSSYFASYSHGNLSIYDPLISVSSALKTFGLSKTIFDDSVYHQTFVSTAGNVSTLSVDSQDVVRLYTDGELAWERDESLASIRDVAVISHSGSSMISSTEFAEEKKSGLLKAFIDRVSGNIHDLTGGKYQSAKDLPLQFGYLKTLVTLTENGKIATFRMYRDGETLSSQLIGVFTPTVRLSKLYVIADKLVGLTDHYKFYHVGLDGEVEECSTEFIKRHFKLIRNERSEIVKILKTDSQDLYTMVKNDEGLVGIHITDTQRQTWHHNGKILSYTGRSYGNDRVASTALVLPDRKVLYKYLVPNLAVVVSYENETAVVKLLNVVTGQSYLTFTKHTDSPESVKAIFEENYIPISTKERESFDTEITVIDLYQSLIPDLKVIDAVKYSSLNDTPVIPEYSSRTYILKGIDIKDMCMTETKNNIATKQVVISTRSGSVVAIPKGVLDGRRPFKAANKKNQAPGFIYEPYIVPADTFILSHYRSLAGSNKHSFIMTIPTEMDSTTYVLSVDTDVFVTTTKPSQSFDTLTSSFNRKTLILTMITLMLAILVVKPMSENKKLKDLWRRN